ncbi:LysR family transcriptional regulator [Streptomyces sp. NPDC096310]|uniref:LysR family transcriptional regulator n=1 Tax=Streptomyces sp. NPDC096310 TaxID=3366082 RepID=UPI003814D35A
MSSIPNVGFTLVQLRYFAAAAELGSMTAASRQLNVSQSVVSTAVAHLEKELGVQLLLRHARGLTLTAAGEDFQRELPSYLEHTAEPVEMAGNAGEVLTCDLSIGCSSTLGPFGLPRLPAGVRPQVRHRSSGFETVRAMVGSGMGWSVLNQRPAHSLTYDGGEVVTLELVERFEPLPTVLASVKGVRLTRRARAFIGSARRAAHESR